MKVQYKYRPTSLDELIMCNQSIKETINLDLKKNNQIKYIIYGRYDHCKTLLSELIIKEYYKRYASSVNIGDKYKYVYRYNCFDDINWLEETNKIQIFCKNHLPFKKFLIFDSCDSKQLYQ